MCGFCSSNRKTVFVTFFVVLIKMPLLRINLLNYVFFRPTDIFKSQATSHACFVIISNNRSAFVFADTASSCVAGHIIIYEMFSRLETNQLTPPPPPSSYNYLTIVKRFNQYQKTGILKLSSGVDVTRHFTVFSQTVDELNFVLKTRYLTDLVTTKCMPF